MAAQATMIGDGRAHARQETESVAGRERELAELGDLAGSARAISLCGPGGIGKSWLLRRLTAGLAPDFPGGAFLISLADLRWPDLVAARVAAAVGVTEEPGVPPLDTLAEALRGRRLLLALDYCDQVAAACADLAARLLADAPGLLVVTTSRAPLGLPGAATWPVPPLAVPPDADQPGSAPGQDAVALFAARAAAAAPGFALEAGNVATVAGICRELGGRPLAIELAAAWAPVLTPDQTAARLGDRSRRVAARDPAAAPGDRALQAVLDGSHDLLSPAEQVLLRRLAVFADWSVELAERVCADDGLPAAWIAGLMNGLAAKALVASDPDRFGSDRYRMPGAVRDDAARRLARTGETAALHRRLRDYAQHVGDYFLSISLAQVPARWAARTQVFQRYQADPDNIRAALGWCLDQGDIEGGLRLCTAFGSCWLVLGALTEGTMWFSAFLAADQSGVPDSVRGPALAAGAHMISGNDDMERAERWAVEGLAACRAAGSLLFTAAALSMLAQAAQRGGRFEEALQYGRESVEQARQTDDKWSEGLSLASYATAQASLGDLRGARDSASQAVALMLEIDQKWGAARSMLGLAGLERALGDLDAARGHYLTALGLLRPIKGDPEISRCLAGLSRVALDQGDLPQARAHLAEALRLSLDTGRRTATGRSLVAFATLAVAEGRPDRAVQLAAAVTALSEAAPRRTGARGRPSLLEAVHLTPGRVLRYREAAAGLGETEVARLWDAGLKLTVEAAAELALQSP
jgi:predicted ATPase